MKNKLLQNEELERLTYGFQTDLKLQRYYHEIANLYSLSTIKSATIIDGEFKIQYDDKTEYEVKRIREIIDEHIKQYYSELFYHP